MTYRRDDGVVQGFFPHGVRLPVRPGQPVQAKRAALGAERVFPLPHHLASLPETGGQPLPAGIRQKMESLFRTTFAEVRVHVGPQAQQIGALAFTHGSHIHFAPGHYNPETPRGREILVHELTHVVQQKSGQVRNPLGSGMAVVDDFRLEAEAAHMVQLLARDRSLRPAVRQATWIKMPNNSVYRWHAALGALRWHYDSAQNKMFYVIEHAEKLTPQELERLKPAENQRFSVDEWVQAGWEIDKHSDPSVISSWVSKKNRAFRNAKRLVREGIVGTQGKGIASKYWGEALDVQHRPIEELNVLFAEYQNEPGTALNFFAWIAAKGKNASVRYLGKEERAIYRVEIKGGKAIGNSIESRYRDHAFVLSLDGVIYAAPKQTEGDVRIHHSSFMSAQTVACAGVMFVQQDGTIFYIKDYSGHYQPGVPELRRLKNYLLEIGEGAVELRKENGNKYKGPIGAWNEQ